MELLALPKARGRDELRTPLRLVAADDPAMVQPLPKANTSLSFCYDDLGAILGPVRGRGGQV